MTTVSIFKERPTSMDLPNNLSEINKVPTTLKILEIYNLDINKLIKMKSLNEEQGMYACKLALPSPKILGMEIIFSSSVNQPTIIWSRKP
jgi:hypothetical protein